MDWASGLSWLAALATATTDARSGDIDGGDMGTAFGLDASTALAWRGEPGLRAEPGPAPWERRVVRRSSL
jgi:hypothetical protein